MADARKDKYRRILGRHQPKFTKFGLSNHGIYKVDRTFSGGTGLRRREGTYSDVETLITPRPEVNILGSRVINSSGGKYQEGDVEILIGAAYDVGGDTGGYTAADFTPDVHSSSRPELFIKMNDHYWEIVEGPQLIEDLLEVRLVVRSRKHDDA